MEALLGMVLWALAIFGYNGPQYEVYVGETPDSLAEHTPGAWAFVNDSPNNCVIGFHEDTVATPTVSLHEVAHCLGLDHEDMDWNWNATERPVIDERTWLALREARPPMPHRVAVPSIAR